ncbi:MAG: mechanosensitive ion channel family protein [Weeksellaceae bacterium]|nr:mechanosensitive ion channel family protein [Weeksellaceae bacterium]
MNLGKFEWILEDATRLVVQIGLAFIIFILGLWLASFLKKIIRKRMIKRNVEPTIREFIIPLLDFLFKLIIILTAISTVGVKVTSLAAVLAGLAAGVGLSLQGSLSNFAGGLLIIFFKPFKVGDYIEALGQSGSVETISILYTSIVTDNQQVVTLPNSSLLNNPIKNYSIKPTRRLDINIGLPYTEDLDITIDALYAMLKNEPSIIKDKPITVEVLKFSDLRIEMAVRSFVKREEYWDTYFKLYKQTIDILGKHNISISVPVSPIQINKK